MIFITKVSTAHLIQIIENYDLCDIWRIRHPKTKRFTFRQNHSSGLRQTCLDYFFISNSLQEMTKYTDILAAFSTDHSPILITLSKINEFDHGKGFWKFSNSLKKNEDYVETIKNVIKSTLRSLDEQGVNNPQARLEFLRYEIQKNSIQFSKTLSKIKNRERLELENKLKVFEANPVLQCDNEYLDCKERLDNLYQEQINGIRIRSRCDWYEYGEKSSKFFLNLESLAPFKVKFDTFYLAIMN